MDRKVVIGIELETKSFDKQIEDVENKIEDIERILSDPKDIDSSSFIKLNAEAERLRNKLIDLNNAKNKIGKSPTNVMDWIKNFGKETEKNIKKVARWALALIGIRGTISLLNRSLNTLTQYDDQLAANVQYLRFAIATALKRVVKYLVQLAYKLMSYVGYIAKAWFGVSLFANASADAMNKTAKSAKDMKKQLAGFDEMNVLSDSSNVGTNSTLPSFDLSQENIKPPEWLVWIGDHGTEVISIISGIAAALVGLNLGLSPIMSLGLGVALGGLVYTIMSLLEYINDPSWENFGKVIQGIGIFVVGLGIAFSSLPGIVIGAIVLIAGTIIKYWDEIKSFLQGGIDWLKSKSDLIHDVLGENLGAAYDVIVETLQSILDGFDVLFKGIKTVLNGIIDVVTGIFTGDWSKAWEGVKKIFAGVFQSLLSIANIVLSSIIGVAITIARTVGQVIWEVLATVVNGVIGMVENIINAPANAINTLIGVINKVPGINLGYLPTVRLPRLARGTIVNRPGKGVLTPDGSAVFGEHGREAYLPLDDTRLLQELGSTIGRYININATIPVQVGNRIVAREMRKINAEDDFAFNK